MWRAEVNAFRVGLKRKLAFNSAFSLAAEWAPSTASKADIAIVRFTPNSGHQQRRRVHLVNWLQDIYPEVAVQLGISALRGPIGSSLSYLRNRTLRTAAANVVVGQRMRQTIASLGISTENVHLIHNWSDDEQIYPVCNADNPLRREWGLDDKFVVGYSGNLGRAHEFDTVLAAAERLRHDPRIVFVFIGGHRMDELARIIKTRGLDATFRFIPYQDRILLKHSLGVPDVHWISLKPAVEVLIVPSKFYGIAAAGRPTIAITSLHGEIARFVLEHSCGLVIEPGQADALADAIARLSTDPESLAAMGARACHVGFKLHTPAGARALARPARSSRTILTAVSLPVATMALLESAHRA